MRIGIVGTGRMAEKRFRALQKIQDVEISWICSRCQSRAESFISRLSENPGSVRKPVALSDQDAAFSREDTDGIIIATPNSHHFIEVKRAFHQGKNVFVEYPHTVDPIQGQEILDAAESRGVTLHVGLTHRYTARHRLLRQRYFDIDGERRLGKPESYQIIVCTGNPISRWYDSDDYSGGMFVSSMYHFIDEPRAFLGNVSEMSGGYRCERNASGRISSDCADLLLRFDGNSAAHLTYARGHPEPGLGSRCTMIFERGYLTILDGRIEEWTPDSDNSDVSPGRRHVQTESVDAVLEDTRAFVDACSGSPDNTPREAQASLRTACEAQHRWGQPQTSLLRGN